MGRATRIRKLFLGRWRYSVTWFGVAFTATIVLIGFFAFATGNNLLFLILAAMLSFGVVSGFLSRLVLAGLEIELHLPEHVSARMPAPAIVRVRNLKYLTPSFSIELSGQPDPDTNLPPILSRPAYFPVIPGRTTLEAPVEVTFPRRGRHLDNLFALTTAFPFGFVRKSTTVPLHRETIVYPAPTPTSDADELLTRITGEVESRFRGHGLDFHRVRPWESGDTARMVDWKNTAHTGTLQVREFAREERKRVDIHLDLAIQPDWFEHAVEICAFLLWNLDDAETILSLHTGAESYAIALDGDIHGALHLLALVEPDTRRHPRLPFDSMLPADSIRVILTSRPEMFSTPEWDSAVLYTGPHDRTHGSYTLTD